MNRKISVCASLMALSIVCTDNVAAGTTEKLPVSDKVAPFTQTGQISAFASDKGLDGTNQVIEYEFHSIELMLRKDIPAINFEVENGKPGNAGYFKAKYRVLYMTKPLTASSPNTVPIPLPPMFGFHDSRIYVKGILMDDNSIAPKVTPWLGLERLQLTIEK